METSHLDIIDRHEYDLLPKRWLVPKFTSDPRIGFL